MTTHTLRPSALVASQGTWTPSAGSSLTCLNDAADGTYTRVTSESTVTWPSSRRGGGLLWYQVGTPTYAGEVPYRFRVAARLHDNDSTSNSTVAWGGYGPSGVIVSRQVSASSFTTASTYYTNYATCGATDSAFGVLLSEWETDGSTGSLSTATRWLDVWLLVESTSVPTATTTAAGTVSTDRPTIATTYADADGWSHTGTEFAVFNSTTYGGGSFNASTSTADYRYTATGPVTSKTLTSSLDTTQTYKTYTRVAKTINGVKKWSAWNANAAWTITSYPPSPPALSVNWQSGTQRMGITVRGKHNLLTANQASLETDTTGWTAGTNCTIDRSSTQAKYDTYSLRMSSTAGGDMTATTPTGTSGVPVTEGVSYVAQAYSRAGTNARNITMQIGWYNSGGSLLSSNTGSGIANSTSNFNALIYVVATAPTNAAYARMLMTVPAGGASELHYFDGMVFTPSEATVNYTPGSVAYSLFQVDAAEQVGGPWRRVVNDVPTGVALGLSDYDYWIKRGITAYYRARTITVIGTDMLTSQWASAYAITTSDGGWWFKPVSDPALNCTGMRVRNPLGVTMAEQAGVFQPLDADYSVVVSGSIYGADGEFELLSVGDTEWTALEPVITHTGTILVQYGDNRQKFVRWTNRDWSETYAAGTTRREVKLAYVEVEAP